MHSAVLGIMEIEEHTVESDIQGNLQAYYSKVSTETMMPQISNLDCISTGWESDIYAFVLEQGAANKRERRELILRIYSGKEAYHRSEREYRGMSQLHSVDFPVPQVLLLERENSPFGQPFVIMEKIDGVLLGTLINRLDDHDKKQESVTLFCNLMLRIHKLDWHLFVEDVSEYETDNPFKFIERELNGRRLLCDRFPASGFLPVLEWLEQRHDLASCLSPSLVHMDFHLTNVLVRADGSPFVIDWGQLDVSDLRFDLAWTSLLLRMHNGTELRNSILQTYERLAGLRVEQIEFFEVHACFRRLFNSAVWFTASPEKSGVDSKTAEGLFAAEGFSGMKRHKDAIKKGHEMLVGLTGIRVPELDRYTDT